MVREGSRRFEGVEPLGNSVQVPYTTCYREDEVREGSVQSNHSELTSKTSTHLAFSALKWFEKVQGGSRGLNHSETVYRYPTQLVPTLKMRFEKVRYSRTTPNSRQRLTHLAFSALKWFEKVRRGSRGLNHSVIVYALVTRERENQKCTCYDV